MNREYFNKIEVVILIMTLCSCVNNTEEFSTVEINLDEVEISGETDFFNLFSEVDFIPLENNSECMISEPRKLAVSDNGFVIFERINQPVIYNFDKNGVYLGKVGGFGHAKSEYQDCVLDVCSNVKGDTIAVSTFFDIKMYDGNGKYLCSQPLEKGYGKNIVSTSRGFVYSSDYSSNSHSLHFLNNKAEIIDEIIDTEGLIIGEFGYTPNALKYSCNSVYYYDQYKSCIYQINVDNHKDIKKILLKSKNIVTPEAYLEENKDNHVYDAICNFFVYDNYMYGQLTYRKFFRLNVDDNSMKINSITGWYPYGCEMSFRNCLYYVLSQDEFIKIGEQHLLPDSIISNYSEVSSEIEEKSNCVIMKIKIKEKYD